MASITKFSPILVSLLLAIPLTAAEELFVGGWAARTPGNCRDGEVDCGSRLPPFRACCPAGQFCQNPLSIPGFEDNTACCATREDCSQQLLTYNVCAADEWGLYNNTGFPFCCEQGLRGGINTARGYDSCRPLNEPFPSGEIALPQDTPDSRVIIASTTSLPPSISTTSSSSTDTSTRSTSPSSDSGSGGLAPGAIAGIVVGCIAVLSFIAVGVWLFRRKNEQRKYEGREEQVPVRELGGTPLYETGGGYHQGGYSDQSSELMGQPVYPGQSPQQTYSNQSSPVYSGQIQKGQHPTGVAELSA